MPTCYRRPPLTRLPLLDPRTSRVVRLFAAAIVVVDGSYSAFKVPIGAAVFQDFGRLSVLTACDIAAGAHDHA